MNEYFYVVMPISLDPRFIQKSDILRKAAASRSKTVHFPFESTEVPSASVVSEVRGAMFVFADLSYERPSCYYELGVAQALNKATFLVALNGTPIHQAEGEIHYYGNLEEYEQLVKQALQKLSPNRSS